MFLMVENSNRWLPPPMTVGVAPVRQKNTTAAQRGGLAGRGAEDTPLSDLQARLLPACCRPSQAPLRCHGGGNRQRPSACCSLLANAASGPVLLQQAARLLT